MNFRLSGLVSRVHLLGALMLLTLVTTQAIAADTIQASSSNGFGRLLITLDPAGAAQPSLEGGVLKIVFDRKVALDPAARARRIATFEARFTARAIYAAMVRHIEDLARHARADK